MRSAFTMIELIFVIVIIGILASVAIPKLAATRDDAKQSKLMANTHICIKDLIAGYKGQENVVIIDSNPACVDAKANGASITYTSNAVRVGNVDASLNGDHLFKGTRVIY